MAYGFLLFLFFSSIMSTHIHACNQTDRSSLMSFILTLSSLSFNWTSDNCCQWKGIACDQDSRVTHLLLPSKGLEGGMFPSSLANLTHLTHLNLSHNSLFGSLDTQFFVTLNRLEILDLSYNLLSGELPFSLPSSNIQKLDLSSNHFHGAIPSSLFHHASKLTSFNVSNNTFTGYIPSSICLKHSSPFLRLLDFSSNEFSGNLAPGLGDCSELLVFRAGRNNLSGLLPEDIYNATKLEEISLPLSSLYGGISDKIVNLTNLAILNLFFNHLGSKLPLNFGKLSKLKYVNLDFNNLEGSLPPSLMNCTNLVELHVQSNNLEGDISILDFSRLSQLTKLDIRLNNFTGTFPISLYSCRSLKAIRLSSNHLEGQIQVDILSLKSLSFLSLGFNRFTNITGAMKILMSCKSLHTLLLTGSFKGEGMPGDDDMADIEGFQNLRALSFAECQLTGQIPIWLSKLNKLEILLLGSNQITGPIPSWLGALPRLYHVSLRKNRISGEFPKQLCRLPRLVSEASQDDTSYEFELPFFLGPIIKNPSYYLSSKLSSYPAMIDLSENNIGGEIPNEISQLQRLRMLRLGYNNFCGIIPDQISNLKNLEVLNLSMNHLSGIIPSSLLRLNFLRSLDVSYNNLQGPIPTSTQIQSFNASSFEGNPKLCGDPLPNKCGPNKGIDGDNKNKDVDNGLHQLPWFYIFAAFGFIVGFWGVCGSLVINKTWRYAYFQFVDNVQDRLYAMVTMRINTIKRSLRG